MHYVCFMQSNLFYTGRIDHRDHDCHMHSSDNYTCMVWMNAYNSRDNKYVDNFPFLISLVTYHLRYINRVYNYDFHLVV